MTPEERKAYQTIEQWIQRGTDYHSLATMFGSVIRAAVAEAVAGEREACVAQLNEAASHYKSTANNEIVAMALEVEATAIRARNLVGEGEGNVRSLSRLANIHWKIAQDVYPDGGDLFRPACGRTFHFTVYDAAEYLKSGWPRCCGKEMCQGEGEGDTALS